MRPSPFIATTLAMYCFMMIHGQNLVPNCDLSGVTTCPSDHSQFDRTRNWFTPGAGTTDLCHSCCGNNAGIPGNMWGFQEPLSGSGYGHIICYYPLQGIDYREYMAVELPCALMAGETYEISFAVSCSDKSKYAINRLGIALTPDELTQPGEGVIIPPGSLALENTSSALADKENWMKIQGTWVASGGEKFLTIGCFVPDHELDVHTFPGAGRVASYYVDAISLIPDHLDLDLGTDTLLCQGETLYLDATLACASDYRWSDGFDQPARIISGAGYYEVEVSLGCGSLSDGIYVGYRPEVHSGLPADTIICPDDVVILDAGDQFESYTWNTGSNGPFAIADGPGTYWVELEDQFGCLTTDTIEVLAHTAPVIDLGGDAVVCYGDSLYFDFTSIDSYSTYVWNRTDTTRTYSIASSGIFLAEVINPCGISRDSITVIFRSCEALVYVPNAFTPDHDGLNDLFKAHGSNIENFSLVIYDRWGRQVFRSVSLEHGWDGNSEGRPCPEGAYVWIIRYSEIKESSSRLEVQTGQLVLLRR